jgi:hypothetical protein
MSVDPVWKVQSRQQSQCTWVQAITAHFVARETGTIDE